MKVVLRYSTDDIEIFTDELADIEASKINYRRGNKKKCNCFPPCYTVDYDAEFLKINFDIKNIYKKIFLDDMKFDE